MAGNVLCPEIPASGFSFDLCARNEFLAKKGLELPKAVKTGTTLAGCVFADGVVIGADARATEGPIVADKICNKLHYLASNIYSVGAGTAGDNDMTMAMIASQLELHRLNTGRLVPVKVAEMILKQYLFRHQGYISAATIIGGYDNTGGHIYTVYPHGSSESLPYATMGSGGMAAMAMLETGWRPGLTEEEAKKLVASAIRGGIYYDLMSGSHVDLCVIRKNSTEVIQPYEETSVKGVKKLNYKFKRGTTAVLDTKVRPIIIQEESIRRIEHESMDVSS